MTNEHLNKMDKCRHLLPEPGAEVVGECIAEIRRLRERVNAAEADCKDLQAKLSEACAAGLELGKRLRLATGEGAMLSDLLSDALALYTPPFRYERGYIFDATGNMVADEAGDGVATRVRGWGRIGNREDAEELQDAVGQAIADALNMFWDYHTTR